MTTTNFAVRTARRANKPDLVATLPQIDSGHVQPTQVPEGGPPQTPAQNLTKGPLQGPDRDRVSAGPLCLELRDLASRVETEHLHGR